MSKLLPTLQLVPLLATIAEIAISTIPKIAALVDHGIIILDGNALSGNAIAVTIANLVAIAARRVNTGTLDVFPIVAQSIVIPEIRAVGRPQKVGRFIAIAIRIDLDFNIDTSRLLWRAVAKLDDFFVAKVLARSNNSSVDSDGVSFRPIAIATKTA